ncbi:MAG: hypothetical protein JJE21_08755 [Spirochaetaceae bacterium]|nr:hypothetical protein [Spirochaetaceae bacterium]
MISNNKVVKVHIAESYPFEIEACRSLWYKISYNGVNGSIVSKKMPKGVHDFSIEVPKNSNTYVIAQVLGDYFPQGGVIDTSTKNKIILTYDLGYLVQYILSIEKNNNEALKYLNFKKLSQMLKDNKLLINFDKLTLARALLNGTLDQNSIYTANNVRVDLDQLPQGYWVSDYPKEGSFWISQFQDKKVILSLNDGIHTFLNIDNGFLCKIIVDSRMNKYFISIKTVPQEISS